jgi:hypothetical protein
LAALALYLLTTALLVAAWRRWVQPISLPVAVVLVLLPFFVTGKALLTGRVHGPIDVPMMSEPLLDYAKDNGVERIHNGYLSDLYMQIIPWAAAVREALRNGEWPLWNPHILCGDVLAAAAQPAVFDPFQMIGLIIPQPASITYGNSITFFLAGFFAFAFARSIGCSALASLVCAVGWMYCAGLAFFVGWPLGRAWAYLPLILFAVRLLVREATTCAAVLLCLSFVLVIVAGHPESILHVVAIGAVYGLFEVWQHRDHARRAVIAAAIAGIVALLVTAIYLLPFLVAVRETVQHAGRSEIFAKNPLPSHPGVIGRRLANTFTAFWGGQPQRQSLSYKDYEPTSGRVGSVIVALAVVALIVARRRRETWFFAALLSITLCAGLEAPPIAELLHALPLFDITLNERLIFAASFAFCVLAAIGIDSLAEERRRLSAAVVAIIAVVLAAASMFLWPSQEEQGIHRELLGLLVAAELLPLAILFVLFESKAAMRTVAATALALVLIQRTVEDGTIYPTLPDALFYPAVPLIDYVRNSLGPDPARVVGVHFAMIPNISTVYGFDDPRGYQAMTLHRFFDTYPVWSIPEPVSFNRVADLTRPFLSMINIRFAIGSKDTRPPDGWKVVASDRRCHVLENTRALPRAFIPNWIQYERDDQKVLLAMYAEQDFANAGWIHAPEYTPHRVTNGPGVLQLRRDGSRFLIDAKMQKDGWVIISEAAWNGWRAYLDGRRVRIHYANNAFLGIFVPAGNHTLRVEYMPEAFTRGRTITVATLLFLISFAVGRRVRRRPARTAAP